jgi:hypothetical protein
MSLRHSSNAQPRVLPWKGLEPSDQINRVQEVTGSDSIAREKIKEVGREGLVGWK